MGTLKNITDEAKDVPLLRRTVAAGEVVEVDDSLLTNADLVWPAASWEVNGAPDANDPDAPSVKAADKRAAAKKAKAAVEGTEPITPDPATDPTAAPAAEVTE